MPQKADRKKEAGVMGTSDGLEARIGALTADLERFMPWRTTEGRTAL